jgi:hypothetical protein
MYHLNNHDKTDEIEAKVTIQEIQSIIRSICNAIELEMFLKRGG